MKIAGTEIHPQTVSTPDNSVSLRKNLLPDRLPAPLWHTGVILFLLLGVSLANTLTSHMATQTRSHIIIYSLTLLWEWILLALVYWGLRMRGTPLRQLLGMRRRGAAELWTDVAIALGFWFASLIVLGAAGFLLRTARLHPEDIRGIVSQIAPASTGELAVWFALAITAGICEELIFRGYLQQQFSVLTRHAWLGIAISAVFFGLAHGYEGSSGVLLITLYGALFGILAQLRGSLRAGMFAHAWHDSISGLVLYFGNHLLHRIPH